MKQYLRPSISNVLKYNVLNYKLVNIYSRAYQEMLIQCAFPKKFEVSGTFEFVDEIELMKEFKYVTHDLA